MSRQLTPRDITLIAFFVALVGLEVPPAIVAAVSPKIPSGTAGPLQPPGVVFAVVWPVLYACLAAAIALLVGQSPIQKNAGSKWTAVALIVAAAGVSWGWMPLFAKNRPAAAWLIVAMLAAAVAAIPLAAKSNVASGALVAVFAAWLVFALVLNSRAVPTK